MIAWANSPRESGDDEMSAHRPAAGGFAADRYARRVTPKRSHVSMQPAQCRLLVEKAVLARVPAPPWPVLDERGSRTRRGDS